MPKQTPAEEMLEQIQDLTDLDVRDLEITSRVVPKGAYVKAQSAMIRAIEECGGGFAEIEPEEVRKAMDRRRDATKRTKKEAATWDAATGIAIDAVMAKTVAVAMGFEFGFEQEHLDILTGTWDAIMVAKETPTADVLSGDERVQEQAKASARLAERLCSEFEVGPFSYPVAFASLGGGKYSVTLAGLTAEEAAEVLKKWAKRLQKRVKTEE